MKKILLATTLLAGSAGFAAADSHITWGGSAAAGIASNGTANGGLADPNAFGKTDDAFHVYSNVNLAVTFSGATDGGLTFGATFDTTAGTSYDLGDEDGFDSNGGSFGMPTVWVEGSFGKLAFSDDNYDFYDDTNAGGDMEYTGTFGAVSVGLIADVDTNEASAKIGFTSGALAINANSDTYGLSNIDVTYTMGSIAITAATDESQNSSIKVAYDANGMSASAKFNTSDDLVDLAAGYSANGLSVNADTNTVSNAWTVTASYDLGGGLSVEAGTNYTQDMMLGAKMAF